MEFTGKERYGITDLLKIVALLRSPGGCPWDIEQTHKSIRRNFIEETYEAVEAIDNDDATLLLEELGDVLLQVIFHTQIETEQGTFTFDDVCDTVSKKMITRHPHIFGGVKADTSAQVLQNWDAIKDVEKSHVSRADTLRGVSKALPALIRADKLQGKAAKSGFCWNSQEEALEDTKAELDELQSAMTQGDKDSIAHEIGDVLFAAANLARHLGVDPEDALSCASDRFIERFSYAEELAVTRDIKPEDADPAMLASLWTEAKNK